MSKRKQLSLLAAAVSALLLTLAMPGLTAWWPLLFVALVPLLTTAQFLSPLESGCMGMFCGILYYSGLLYWIVIVLQQYGGLHTFFAVGALGLLVLYMSMYTAFFCLSLAWLAARQGEGKGSSTIIFLAAPALWVGFDMLRGLLFTGMPWMDLGYGLYQHPLLIQAADLGGHHLITYLLVQINSLIFWLMDRIFSRQPASSRLHYICAFLVAMLIYCVGGYSTMRYWQVYATSEIEEQVSVAVAQGNIDQREKWSPARKDSTIERYLTLSNAALEQNGADLVVWPETALPFFPAREPLMNKVKQFAKKEHIYLLTGSPFFTVDPERPVRPVEYFNSALMVNPEGRLVGRYNKQHLVPFGEYVPLRDWLWFIKPLVELVGDFTPGISAEPLEAEKIKAGVLICFESIFPSIAQQTTKAGANLLVSLTNDAWYGYSSAPYHSWAMTVFRAVENRRSLVRAANTGISGFVEPTGRITSASPIFVPAAWKETIPLMTEQTFFTLFGHFFGLFCLFLIPLLILWKKNENRRR
jgi:apolipoprotein N-acyltransferase